MQVDIQETTMVYPAKPPFTEDHVLSLSHLDTDRNLNVTFRYLRAYLNNKTATANHHQADPLKVISDALSAALVHYYPYTGTLHRRQDTGRFELHCISGGGVPIVCAKVDSTLNSVNYLDEINGDEMDKFVESLVPNPNPDEAMTHPLMLQLTRFECGGHVLGAAVHHAMCDGLGATIFFNTMAELARGAVQIKVEPVWNRAELLGPRDPVRVEFPIEKFLGLDKGFSPYAERDGPVIRECFEVKDEWLDRMKEFLLEKSGSKYTTFEALGAFLWRARIKASRVPGDEEVKFAYATNVRRVVKPALPPGYWGNGCVPMYVQALAKDLVQQPLWETAELIKKSKFNITDEYVRSFIDFQEQNYHKGINAGPRVSGFTDWRHLGHSTVDFGWGGPVTVLPLSRHLLGSTEPCFFLPYSSATEGEKDGFKVSVCLPKDAMPAFREEMDRLGNQQFCVGPSSGL